MTGDKRTRLKEWLESGEARLYPLTFSQRELWEASPVPVADPSNHICCVIHVQGLVTLKDSESALRRVGDRQESLRVSFLPGKEKPLQMVRKAVELDFNFRELTAAEGKPEAIEEIAQQIFAKPFDLVQGPLYRTEILRRTADDHLAVLSMHHAIGDGWTLGVFVQDLCGAYLQGIMGLKDPLPPVALSYTDWGAAERAQWTPAELQRCGDFWRATLAGHRRIWDQPESSSSTTHQLERIVSEWLVERTGAARRLARQCSATLFSTLLAAFQVTLAEWTGVDDIVVGTPVANRGNPGVKETMGYCAGNVPLRGRVDPGRPLAEAIPAVQNATTEAFSNAMPFVELLQAVGETPRPGYSPVYQVRFALQNHPVPDVSIPGLSARLRMRSTGTPRFDLGCEITERGDTFEVVWLFRATMFSVSDIEELDRRFAAVLASAARAPERPVEIATN
jgi:hypothetical protein